MKSKPKPIPLTPHWAESSSDTAGSYDGEFLRNGWLMVLERKWYAFSVLLACVLGAAIYTYFSTPIYEGVVTLQVLKHGAQVLRVADVVESSVTNDSDFNTQIKVLESVAILQSVASRLTPEELKLLTDPFKSRGTEPGATGILYEGRRIVPQRFSLITTVYFRHPNPRIAARVANLIASEYIAYNSRLRVEESMKAVDDLKDRADQQRKRVNEIANAQQAFRERGNLISLVQSKDIVTEKLKALNLMATQAHARLNDAVVRQNLVQEWSRDGKDLSEIPFIASQAKVNQIILQITTQKLLLAQLRERYKDKHPRLIEATNTLAQAEQELKTALAMAASTISAEYEDALHSDEAARKSLSDQEGKSLDLGKSAVEYDNLDRDFRVNNQLLESMISRIRETSVSSSIETDNARIIDRAFDPTTPVSPKIFINLMAGLIVGTVFGLGVAYLVATIDDRVKTAFDVETMVGLPLLGVVPRVARMDQPDKAQIVSNGADRVIVEAFLSLYSTLRINDDSRTAKFIAVTSTLPGEGKSFVATNLALTFALQGQRTAIIDCDLRKPNVQRSFRLRASKGVINYCLDGASLEEVTVKSVQPNLDVIPAGGRAKNPIQLFNSREFEALIIELGKRYDRVVFDTPPLGAVSDVLNLMPLMDGAIYAIQFNRVKRRMARRCARQLVSANIPVFGAVLNDMNAGFSGDYYTERDSKMLKEYYDPKADDALATAS